MTGLKVNQDVFKKCTDFIKKMRESTQLKDLMVSGEAYPDFIKNLDTLNLIEMNLKEYKYSSTPQMSQEFLKLMSDLIRAAASTPAD